MRGLEGIEKELRYDPETGLFHHLKTKGNIPKDGIVKSLDSHGYIRVSYKGKRYLGHRVAFWLMSNNWPKDDVDHVNGVRDDNRWCNLREATRGQNLHNQKCTRGKSKYKGVIKYRDSWIAQIGSKEFGKKYLGAYSCEEEAGLAYNYKAYEFFGAYARFNQVFDSVEVAEGD